MAEVQAWPSGPQYLLPKFAVFIRDRKDKLCETVKILTLYFDLSLAFIFVRATSLHCCMKRHPDHHRHGQTGLVGIVGGQLKYTCWILIAGSTGNSCIVRNLRMRLKNPSEMSWGKETGTSHENCFCCFLLFFAKKFSLSFIYPDTRVQK